MQSFRAGEVVRVEGTFLRARGDVAELQLRDGKLLRISCEHVIRTPGEKAVKEAPENKAVTNAPENKSARTKQGGGSGGTTSGAGQAGRSRRS